MLFLKSTVRPLLLGFFFHIPLDDSSVLMWNSAKPHEIHNNVVCKIVSLAYKKSTFIYLFILRANPFKRKYIPTYKFIWLQVTAINNTYNERVQKLTGRVNVGEGH